MSQRAEDPGELKFQFQSEGHQAEDPGIANVSVHAYRQEKLSFI